MSFEILMSSEPALADLALKWLEGWSSSRNVRCHAGRSHLNDVVWLQDWWQRILFSLLENRAERDEAPGTPFPAIQGSRAYLPLACSSAWLEVPVR